MSSGWLQAGELLRGSVARAFLPVGCQAPWPFTFHARLCDLRPRFLVKRDAGPGLRAVARNGRVLLCGDRPLELLTGQIARLRLQTWHRTFLPGDAPQPYGVLLCVRCLGDSANDGMAEPIFETRLVKRAEAAGEVGVDVGGRLVLECRLPARSGANR